MDILLKTDARKTKENVFFFSEGLGMLTCALDTNAMVAIRVIFFFFSIIIMTKALLYLKQC